MFSTEHLEMQASKKNTKCKKKKKKKKKAF